MCSRFEETLYPFHQSFRVFRVFGMFSEYNIICLDGLDLCENDKEFLGVSWFWMFSELNETAINLKL